MEDRRSPARRKIDAYLDDLQSEMEAGARAIKEIHAEASRVDRVVTSQLRLAHMSGLLVSRVANLRRSVRMQLHTLKDLRGTMRGLRTVRRPNHQS